MLAPQDIWNDPVQLVSYYTNRAIPISPLPGILVLSIIVSILGSYATLLLLGRRTSARGLRNHFFLGLAATCFAAVAVWGMHFVSMISIRLKASPDVTWFLLFSPGMTALSLFVPLIATIGAFVLLGDEDTIIDADENALRALINPMAWLRSWRILASGFIMGLTITLMHYSASFQLPYLTVSYSAVTVVFAAVLACVASTAALALFFRARVQWQDSFWKRGLCSLFLASAVCGMHYLGLGGTSYMAKSGIDPNLLSSGDVQSTKLIIAISVMCGVIILIAVVLALIDYRTRRDLKAKAKQVVLASVAFDEHGKILVKADGTIPMQVMQVDTDFKNITAQFDPRMSTFQWLYQLSFCWTNSVTPYVPRITAAASQRGKGTFQEPSMIDKKSNAAFRGRFVEAAVQLAHSLDLSVDSIGVLFDRVLQTGTKAITPEEVEKMGYPSPADEESVHGITLRLGTSEGVMVFLAREIGKGKPRSADFPDRQIQAGVPETDTVQHYLENGWRLAETRFFSKSLADAMGVNKPEMDIFLSACKTYAKRGTQPVVQEGGVYLGLFGVRPTGSHDGGLDVLVYNFARHQIPAYRLPDVSTPLSASCSRFIEECANATLADILNRCNDTLARAEGSDAGSFKSRPDSEEDDVFYDFLAALAVSLESLSTACRCWPDLPYLAKLHPTLLELPCSDFDDKRPATMLMMNVILPAPEARLTPVQTRASGIQVPGLDSNRRAEDRPPSPFVYTPWNLFARAQTMILRGGVYRDIAKSYAQELSRLYPAQARDVLAELDAADKAPMSPTSPTDPGNPFTDVPQLNNSRRNKGRRPSTTGAMIHLDEIEKLDSNTTLQDPPAGRKSRPTTSAEPGTLRGPFGKENEVPRLAPGAKGPPIYAGVRNRADGWHVRMMRSLEQGQRGMELEGTDWASQAKLLPIN